MHTTPRFVAHWPWFALWIVLLLLGASAWLTLHMNFNDELNHHRESFRHELRTISAFLASELQAGRYQDLEPMLREWGKAETNIAELQLVAANGFVLADYQRAGEVEHALTLEQPISYSYRGEARLRARLDLANLYRHHRRLMAGITGVFAVCSVLLFLLVFEALQRRREAARLRQRTQELDAARGALAVSEERLKMALEATQDGLWDWDVQTNVAYLSARWKAILGYAPGELVDSFETWDQHLHPEDRPQVLAALQAHLDDSAHVFEPEFRMRHKNGDWVWILSRGSVARRDAAGRPLRMVGAITDISVRKEAETERERLLNELEQRATEMERFVYTISHDLKAPLITISGFAKLLAKDIERNDKEQGRDSIEEIREAAEGMQQLIEDLLQLSRTGHIQGEPEDVDLDALLSDLRARCARHIERERATIRVASPLPRLHVDRGRFGQVLQNLLDNGVKFHRKGVDPVLEIGAERDDGETRLYVRDNGSGIEKRFQEKIFGLFQRLDTSREGTGVGLTIARRIVEQHGGQLSVESEPGKGSTFWISLPESAIVADGARDSARENRSPR